jgi:uncharacterized protein with HEPN domain
MPPTDDDRLQHILEAARDATDFAQGRTRADLDHDRMLRRALVQCVQVIGEAASGLSPEARARLADIPWREIRRMRNVLVHAYFGISLDILWRTIVEDLPPLIQALERTLHVRQSRP